jgi:hypothetical protein
MIYTVLTVAVRSGVVFQKQKRKFWNKKLFAGVLTGLTVRNDHTNDVPLLTIIVLGRHCALLVVFVEIISCSNTCFGSDYRDWTSERGIFHCDGNQVDRYDCQN